MHDSLWHTWVWLVVLSLATTGVSLVAGIALPFAMAGTVILAFAWAKARLIAGRYLGLARAPSLRRGFDLVMALYMGLLLVLYLIPAMMT